MNDMFLSQKFYDSLSVNFLGVDVALVEGLE